MIPVCAEKKTYTTREVAQALGVSSQTVVKMAADWPKIESRGRGRGGKVFRYSYGDLPDNVKLAIPIYEVEGPPNKPKASTQGRQVESPNLANWQNKVALARADLVRLYLKEKQKAKVQRRSKVEAAELFIKGYNTGQLHPHLFKILGKKCRQAVDKWAKDLRDADGDYTALAPQWGNRKGGGKVTNDEFNMVLSFVLHPNRLRISEACRLAKLRLKHRKINSPSSERTLRRAVKAWRKLNYDRWIFCREGEKALNDKCLPYLERDAGLLDVGEVLVADGHVLNFQILHPFTGKPCRMTMVAWYDWASRYMAGFQIMPTEDVQCVAAGLRNAILRLGKMAKVAYLDNGKAFKSKIFTDPGIDFEEAGFYGMFARLGMETIFAWPYNAQSKPVERFFGTFSEIERLMPTYVGTSIENKPPRMLRNEAQHRKLYEKRYGGWVPTIEEAARIIQGWHDEYAERPSSALRGLCPGEVFESGRGPGVDEGELRHLMMSIDAKQIHRNGVRMFGRNYYDEALYGRRDRVIVRYDFEDLSNVLIYDMDEKLICRADAIQALHPVAKFSGRPEDLATVKEDIKRKRTLKRETEKWARVYVEDAPALVALPAPQTPVMEKTVTSAVLTREEAERIEKAAGEMQLLELKPKEPNPIFLDDSEKYEFLFERECRGIELSSDNLAFLRRFEKTKSYQMCEDRYRFLSTYWGSEMEGSAL